MRLSFLLIPALAVTSACNSALIEEAKEAESEGRVLNNRMMSVLYPQTYREGTPQYLERDFEAGANFICDEIKAKKGNDICADPEIGWRD